jgi:hypothetical protein
MPDFTEVANSENLGGAKTAAPVAPLCRPCADVLRRRPPESWDSSGILCP